MPDDRARGPFTVDTPLASDGVGLALRCAYLPRGSDLPPDFEMLLAELK